jgi:hypothetical protein
MGRRNAAMSWRRFLAAPSRTAPILAFRTGDAMARRLRHRSELLDLT